MTSFKTLPPVENPIKAAFQPGYRHHEVVPMRQFYTPPASPSNPNPETQELYLPMVLLKGYEDDQVAANAYHDTLAAFKGKAPKKEDPSNWDEMLDANRAYWTIFLSARIPGKLDKQWFDTIDEVRATYNWDEAGVILSHYLSIRMTQPCYTQVDFNSPTVFQDLIDLIKRNGNQSDFFFNGVTSHTVNQLLKYLAAHQESSPKSNG